MKSKFYTFITLFFLLTANSFSQAILNSSFENWTINTFYEDPVYFNFSSNAMSFMSTDSGNVTKTTDRHSGSFAARLQTIENGTDTIFGGIFIGTPGAGGLVGGKPYVGRPDSLVGFIKYNILPADTATILVGFKKLGNMFAVVSKTITGSQASYARFSLPVTYWAPTIPSDSIIVIITSSNLEEADPKMPGSILYVDDLQFTGTLAPAFPNGGFENWTSVTSEEPDYWSTVNFGCVNTGSPAVTKSLDSYSGAYSMRIENVVSSWGDTVGYATNGFFGSKGPAGGMPVVQNPQRVTGYYKFFAVGGDSCLVSVTSYKYDFTGDSIMVLDQYLVELPPTGIYTSFEIPLTYNGFPVADTVNITFAAGQYNDSTIMVHPGSVMLVDNLNIDYYPLIADNISMQAYSEFVYPNPAQSNVYIRPIATAGGNINLAVFDIYGKKVLDCNNSISDGGSEIKINVSYLPAGMYFYRLNTENNNKQGKFLIER